MKLDSAEVAIIGGGVSGLSSAYFLANAGVNVVVIEKGLIGEEASARNGGSMSPRADEPFAIPMATRARETWTTLHEELGYPTEFIHEGRLQVAMREEEMDLVRAMSINAPKYGVEARAVDPEEMRSLVPELTDKALGACIFPTPDTPTPSVPSKPTHGPARTGAAEYTRTLLSRASTCREAGCRACRPPEAPSPPTW